MSKEDKREKTAYKHKIDETTEEDAGDYEYKDKANTKRTNKKTNKGKDPDTDVEHKRPLTIEEQITRLQEKGIIVRDKFEAESVLMNVSYFTLSGYFKPFLDYKDQAKGHVTLDMIYRIYKFDRRLTSICRFLIDKIEEQLKTRIAYYSAQYYKDKGPVDFYLQKEFFKEGQIKRIQEAKRKGYNTKKTRDLCEDFVMAFELNKDNYGGKYPIWVAVKWFTFWMIEALYECFPKELREEIASSFNTQEYHLQKWINNFRSLRNILAHNGRLYDFKLEVINIPRNLDYTLNVSNKIFSYIYLMRHLSGFDVADVNGWEFAVRSLKELLESDNYKDIIELDKIGFPENWEEVLMLFVDDYMRASPFGAELFKEKFSHLFKKTKYKAEPYLENTEQTESSNAKFIDERYRNLYN